MRAAPGYLALLVIGGFLAGEAVMGESQRTDMLVGKGKIGPAFEDQAPTGAVLIGVKVTQGYLGTRGFISSLQPIYRQADGQTVFGAVHGTEGLSPISVEAKPGYAVGALITEVGPLVDGLRCIFYRCNGDELDPKDSYLGRWMGAKNNPRAKQLGGDGSPVIGVFGHAGDLVGGIGLIQKSANDAK